jgi:hypothetical protein
MKNTLDSPFYNPIEVSNLCFRAHAFKLNTLCVVDLRSREGAWMSPVKQHRHTKHQRRIEHIQRPLIHQKITIVAHHILRNTEDAPYHDQCTDHVEHTQILLPFGVNGVALGCRILANLKVEEDSCKPEEPKHDELDAQTAQNHVLAELDLALIPTSHHSTTSALDHKREDIAAHENLGEPCWSDDRKMPSIDSVDDSAEGHVDGGSEEGRREENK